MGFLFAYNSFCDIITCSDSMENKNFESAYNLFWIFIVGCVVGWIIEGIFTYITKGIFINHSAVVVGPFNMAYGISACLLTALLYKYRNEKNIKLFLIGFLGGSIIEYVMSWGMELVVGFSAWDYSDMPLNVNGRICFYYSLFWGFLSIFWIKFIYPKLVKMIKKLDYALGKKIVIGLLIFLILDVALTCSAVLRAKEKDKGIEAQNKYEDFLDKTFNKDYLKNMFNNKWE